MGAPAGTPGALPGKLEAKKEPSKPLVVPPSTTWRNPGTSERTHGFQELFAGFAGLTAEVQKTCGHRVWIAGAHDTRFGDDIADDEEFSKLISRTGRDVPTWIHAAPPCRTFTKARRKDKHGTVRTLRTEGKPDGFGEPETEEANLIADRTAAIGERQVEEGEYISIENPLESFIWERKSMQRLAARKGMAWVELDQCAYGGPYKKPTMILTNAPWLRPGKRCSEAPPHSHTTLEGKVFSYKLDRMVWFTSEAAEYPSGLCEEWAEQWSAWLDTQDKGTQPQPKYARTGRFHNKLVREELLEVPPQTS